VFWIDQRRLAVSRRWLLGAPLIGLGLGVALGLGAPRWVLSFLAQRRVNKFTSEFANAMDIIVRGIKSGPAGSRLPEDHRPREPRAAWSRVHPPDREPRHGDELGPGA
jgi:hypothetical protein